MKSFSVKVKKKINKFNKSIFVEGDKSISHRALLISSQAYGVSKLKGLLESEDVSNTINALKKLGVKIIKYKDIYYIYGNGLGSFKTQNNLTINAGNSGTLARLLMGLLTTYPHKIKIIGEAFNYILFQVGGEPVKAFLLKNKFILVSLILAE